MKTTKYARKTFYVDQVQVTEENMEEVAKWCQGDIQTAEEGKYVRVRVHRPLTERQTMAFVGDHVLYAGTGYKVYTPRAFEKSFEKVVTLTKEQADEAGIHPPIESSPSPRVLDKGRIHSMSLDAKPGSGGGKIESVEDELDDDENLSIEEQQAQFAARQSILEADYDDDPGAEAERILAEIEKDR